MENIDFKTRVEMMVEEDGRYPYEAYDFVNAAVKFSIDRIIAAESGNGIRRHINAVELLDGMVEFAQQQFGPLAWEVLRNWHLTAAKDIGKVVFNMVNHRLLSRSDRDTESDFNIPYDLEGKLMESFRRGNEARPGLRSPIIV